MADKIPHINSASWDSEVNSSSLPVLVDFWAEWCGPCRAIAPILDDLSVEMADRIKIVKVNVDEAPELANQFGVRSIPTLIVIKNGKVVGQMLGAMQKGALKSKIEAILSS